MANWDSGELTTSEMRAPRPEDEQPVRHRRRRNTKRWCRGKIGVEHVTGIRLKRSIARIYPYHRTGRGTNHWPANGETCGWSWWLWRLYDDWYYRCNHERYCTACGKIFELERTECPDYGRHSKPTISPRQVETSVRAAKTARAARR